jgi:hypothetical protein
MTSTLKNDVSLWICEDVSESLTGMVFLGHSNAVTALVVTGLNEVGRDVLENEGLVGTSVLVDREGSHPPVRVDLLV